MKAYVLAGVLLLAGIQVGMAADTPPPRVIDMTVVLKDPQGKPIIDQLEGKADATKPGGIDCSACGNLTVGHAIANALFANLPSETNAQGVSSVSPEQKWARGALAERIKDDKTATLTASEIVVVKKLVGQVYGTNVIMQIFPLLDPSDKPPPLQ
jgi:hypothetical protein